MLVASEAQTNNDQENTYTKGSEFRLCGDTDLCSDAANCSHKSELCVVEHNVESKIIYDTIHG